MFEFIIGLFVGAVLMAMASADAYEKGWDDCEMKVKSVIQNCDLQTGRSAYEMALRCQEECRARRVRR